MVLRRRRAAVPVRVRGRGTGVGPGPAPACAAPATQLRFDPNGLVTSCCRSIQPLGQIGHDRLVDIWNGERHRAVVAAMERHDYSLGCQRCRAEVDQEGPEFAYARAYDGMLGRISQGARLDWPVRAEFNLSNLCNLQCIQCDGDSSSMIRIHREHRPPLPVVYDDEFFDDLVPFLEHLEVAVFAGGEPFLAPANFRVWDLIAANAPDLRCSVVTNATQWSSRILDVLERLRMDVVISLDGISAGTYDGIRVGASIDHVMANIEELLAYRDRTGATVSINHCLMPQNHQEFGDLLLWAEERRLVVNVCVVRAPAHCSIARLPVEGIRAIDRHLTAIEADVVPRLGANLPVWEGERARIRSWMRDAAHRRPASHTVMFFRCQGAGPVDDAEALRELSSVGDALDVIRVAIGADDVIRWCDWPSGPIHASVVGGSHQDLTNALVSEYGDLLHWQVVATSDDRVDATACFGDRPARIVYLAMRDEDGWADEARVLIAVERSR